jgi:hypothetical protein
VSNFSPVYVSHREELIQCLTPHSSRMGPVQILMTRPVYKECTTVSPLSISPRQGENGLGENGRGESGNRGNRRGETVLLPFLMVI